MTPTTIALCALVVASLTMIANVWTTVRAGQWRNSDDGKEVNRKIGEMRDKVTVIETTMRTIPTAADIARLTAISESNHELLLISRAAIARLEGFFWQEKDR